MKKLKSTICLLLTLVLIFCTIPAVTASAAETEDSGTETVVNDVDTTADTTDETVSTSSPTTFAARASYATGKYAQRAVVWTWNGESLEYTYNGQTHDSAYLIMHEVWYNDDWAIAYCVEPGINIVSSSTYDSEQFNGDTLWGYFDAETQRAVSLALLYGYPNSLNSSDLSATVAYQVATYMIIHELILDWRETTYPYAQLDDSFYDVFGGGTAAKPEKLEITSDFYPELEGTFLDREDIANAYEYITEKLEKHDLIPSFASSFKKQAPTYTMTANSDGTYSVTLTDTNGILSEYSFTNTDDLTFKKSSNGKSVTITTSNPDIGTVTVAPTKTVPSVEASAYLIWTSDTGSQALVTTKTTTEDPIPAYFKVTIPTGTCKIVKESTNGGTVEGWKFTVKDATGKAVGTYTTNSAGIITVDLDPGTYIVTEINNGDDYWYCDTTPQIVTVTAGKTATVTFENQWIGKAKIVKALDNPEAGTVEGWTFTIADGNGQEIGTYTTDSEGTILVDLEPGNYTVTEVLEEDSLWQCASQNSETITVTAGETAVVTFTNALRPGRISVLKTDIYGQPLAGSKFILEWSEDGIVWTAVTQSDQADVIKGCSADAGTQVSPEDGIIEWTNLYPGIHYRITELEAPEGYNLLATAAFEGQLPVDDLTVTLRVVNAQTFMLPETGSHAPIMLPLSAALCLTVCAEVLFILRKKED